MRPPYWLVALVPPLGFAAQEQIGRVFHTGALTTMPEASFVLGLLLQLPIALLALWLVRVVPRHRDRRACGRSAVSNRGAAPHESPRSPPGRLSSPPCRRSRSATASGAHRRFSDPEDARRPGAPSRRRAQNVLTPRFRSRGTRRFAVRLAVALAALVAAPAAMAHATVVSTSPENNEVVPTSPAQVTISYSEPVETAFGGVRVFNDSGERVDDGRARAAGRQDGRDRTEPRPRGGDVHGHLERRLGRHASDPRRVRLPRRRRGGEPGRHRGRGARKRRRPTSVARSYDVVRFVGFVALFLSVGGVGRAAALPAGRPAARAAQALVRRRRRLGPPRAARAGDDRPPGRGRGGIRDRPGAALEHRVRGARHALRPRDGRAHGARGGALRVRDLRAADPGEVRARTRRRRSSRRPGSS